MLTKMRCLTNIIFKKLKLCYFQIFLEMIILLLDLFVKHQTKRLRRWICNEVQIMLSILEIYVCIFSRLSRSIYFIFLLL